VTHFGFPLFPDRASSLAGRVDALFYFDLAVSIFFSALIAGLLIFFFVKYRRRSQDEVGSRVEGSLALEIAWIAVPLVIAMIAFAWGAEVFFELSRPPAGATEYYAVGKQWMWKFQHPEGNREIDELHVPIGRPIRMTMTSEDVIHSFFVPAFRVKQDVLPGRYFSVGFEATKPGVYHLFCAEYCGAGHSRMTGRVVALGPHDYEAWLAGGLPAQSMRGEGEEIFAALACASCHRDEPGTRGPSLAGLFGRRVQLQGGRTALADETYLRESILNPAAKVVSGYPAIMPTYQGQIHEEELVELIHYIKALPARAAVPGPPAAERAAARLSPGAGATGSGGANP